MLDQPFIGSNGSSPRIPGNMNQCSMGRGDVLCGEPQSSGALELDEHLQLYHWLLVTRTWIEHIYFPDIYEMSSFQLTKSVIYFFREVGEAQPPTRYEFSGFLQYLSGVWHARSRLKIVAMSMPCLVIWWTHKKRWKNHHVYTLVLSKWLLKPWP